MRNVRSVIIGAGLGIGCGALILSFHNREWALMSVAGFLAALVADWGEMFRRDDEDVS